MTPIVLSSAVIALFAFVYFLRRFSTAWSMRDWQRTQGRVVTAEMRRGKKKSPDGCLLYDPVLRYSYSVGGTPLKAAVSRIRPYVMRPV